MHQGKRGWVRCQPGQDLSGIRNVVYLLTHPDDPGLIKIGSTVNLKRRVTGYTTGYEEYVRATVIAYFSTPYFRELETAMLARFHKVLLKGDEWFAYDPVMNWLTEVSR